MSLEIADKYDREAVAAIFRALDADAIARSADMGAIVHSEVRARCLRLVDAIRKELMAGLAARRRPRAFASQLSYCYRLLAEPVVAPVTLCRTMADCGPEWTAVATSRSRAFIARRGAASGADHATSSTSDSITALIAEAKQHQVSRRSVSDSLPAVVSA